LHRKEYQRDLAACLELHRFRRNKLLRLALGADMPAGVRMIVSGHIHFFQAVDFGGVRPPQLVVGTGETISSRYHP
jgi:hypothetical protein